MINIRYCKKCRQAYDVGIYNELCQKCIEERKRKVKERYIQKDEEEYKKSLWLDKENEKKLKLIQEKKETPNWYTCQKCKREFVALEECKININKFPICEICKEEE